MIECNCLIHEPRRCVIIIQKHIGTSSVEESNDFLRKLWGELHSIRKLGWSYQPCRTGNRIFIGHSTIGSIEFDYVKKGEINDIYIDADEAEEELVVNAIEHALASFPEKTFFVNHQFDTPHRIPLHQSSCEGVEIGSEKGKNYVRCSIRAYSERDCDYWINQTFFPLMYFLCAYTNRVYTHRGSKKCNGMISNGSFVEKYDYGWIDIEDCPCDERGAIILPNEFLILSNRLMKSKFYSQNLQAVINSAQLLYSAKSIAERAYDNPYQNRTGFLDIINTLCISSLESLLIFDGKKSEPCSECGQPRYSIVSRVYDLSKAYLGESLALRFKKTTYRNRSKYLHEGLPMTVCHYDGSCFPLIDPVLKNEMLMPNSFVDYNLLDYVGYVFRRIVKDHICDIA